MRILFMGTPDFSVPCLKALIASEDMVVGVVTQPDKPKGRGHKMQPPPVKETAEAAGIPVFQPPSLKNGTFHEVLEQLQPELIIVVAYGKILPTYILEFPAYGCINVHASLLPKYRGAGPIQWSVIHGEQETGITTMYMEEGLDTGDMLLSEKTLILPDENAGQLHDRLSEMGASVLLRTISALKSGTLTRIKQDDRQSSYAPMMEKETGKIDWTAPAEKIHCLIRGTNPWPVAYTWYGDEMLKVYKAHCGGAEAGAPGEIKSAGKQGIVVVCGDGMTLCIEELQFKGGKRMPAASYLNGHSFDTNIVLK